MYLRSLADTWNAFGERDPLWAVLTNPGREGNRWDESEFFETGRADVAFALQSIDRLRFPLRRHRALDFGCAVGRLTQALACYFDEVVGVDIAPAMIRRARAYNSYGDRCRFHVNPHGDLRLFEDNSFDFVFSILVLQHMRPRYARRYIAEFMRVLKPGGLLLFQEPTHYCWRKIGSDYALKSHWGCAQAERWMHKLYDRWSPPPPMPALFDREEPPIIEPKHPYLPPRFDRDGVQTRRDPPHLPGGAQAESDPARGQPGQEKWRKMPLYTIRRWKMLAYLRRLGGRIVDVQPRNECTPHHPSLRYFVTK